MRITIGPDHAGFDLKKVRIDHLRQSGHQLVDVGTRSTEPVDYPYFAEAVSLSLLRGEGDRAGLRHDCYSAHQCVENDDVNLQVLGAGTELAKDLCTTFLKSRFTAEGRHRRRLAKTLSIEQRYATQAAAREQEP